MIPTSQLVLVVTQKIKVSNFCIGHYLLHKTMFEAASSAICSSFWSPAPAWRNCNWASWLLVSLYKSCLDLIEIRSNFPGRLSEKEVVFQLLLWAADKYGLAVSISDSGHTKSRIQLPFCFFFFFFLFFLFAILD